MYVVNFIWDSETFLAQRKSSYSSQDNSSVQSLFKTRQLVLYIKKKLLNIVWPKKDAGVLAMCNIRQSVFRYSTTLTNTHSIRIRHFSMSGTIHQNTIAVSMNTNILIHLILHTNYISHYGYFSVVSIQISRECFLLFKGYLHMICLVNLHMHRCFCLFLGISQFLMSCTIIYCAKQCVVQFTRNLVTRVQLITNSGSGP